MAKAGSTLPGLNAGMKRVKGCESQTTLDKLGCTFATCMMANNNELLDWGLNWEALCCVQGGTGWEEHRSYQQQALHLHLLPSEARVADEG